MAWHVVYVRSTGDLESQGSTLPVALPPELGIVSFPTRPQGSWNVDTLTFDLDGNGDPRASKRLLKVFKDRPEVANFRASDIAQARNALREVLLGLVGVEIAEADITE